MLVVRGAAHLRADEAEERAGRADRRDARQEDDRDARAEEAREHVEQRDRPLRQSSGAAGGSERICYARRGIDALQEACGMYHRAEALLERHARVEDSRHVEREVDLPERAQECCVSARV